MAGRCIRRWYERVTTLSIAVVLAGNWKSSFWFYRDSCGMLNLKHPLSKATPDLSLNRSTPLRNLHHVVWAVPIVEHASEDSKIAFSFIEIQSNSAS